VAGYEERTYRNRVRASGLCTFHVLVKETDLWVSADSDLVHETRDLVFDLRHQLESYIARHPRFLSTLEPWPDDPLAPPLVRDMIRASGMTAVGPMAAVAGALAQHAGEGLLEYSDQVIVENGGDIFMLLDRSATVNVFAGRSPLSEKIGIRIERERMPMGICSSSGTVGHSLSLGKADAVCLLSKSAGLADAGATALGNRIRHEQDLHRFGHWAEGVKGLLGGLIILGKKMAAWGEVELVRTG
jgi:uncharacterized protein